MKKHSLNDILDRLAEEGVPEDLDLRTAVHSRLESSVGQPPKGRFVMKPRMIVIAAIALLGVFLFTPQGSALAQKALQFFTPADDLSFSLVVTDTPEPAAIKPTATSASPMTGRFDTIEAAEAFNQIDIPEFPFPLPGLELSGVTVSSDSVTVQYDVLPSTGGGGYLYLYMWKDKTPFSAGKWDNVPSEAVEVVQVGDFVGEYVSGHFAATPGGNSANWDEDAPDARLRWRDDAWNFELELSGGVLAVDYLNKENMIALARSLTDPTVRLNTDEGLFIFTNPTDAETVMGVEVVEPAYLPEVLHLTEVYVENPGQSVRTWYREEDVRRIVIKQVLLEDLAALDISQEIENMVIDPIQVGFSEGWIGSVDGNVQMLWWPGEVYAYRISHLTGVPDWVTPLGLEDLLAIAESMK
jgi:hypothetical protein